MSTRSLTFLIFGRLLILLLSVLLLGVLLLSVCEQRMQHTKKEIRQVVRDG